ncbi:hypothetical protein [Methylobacterium sp. CCH5-D2]|uniref:hypothetical protein n=1 Tax=Methylobacterium sp. CCH5-D2 TaxID=1768765 RepID=UPI00082D29EB|nr:hypothetical protein [Methylobacterium sp. CCH5-D2]
MHRSLDREALERRVIGAHRLTIAALAHAERVEHAVRSAVPGVCERDRLVADGERHRRFIALRDLLDALGYVPRGLTARLPPEPGARWPCRYRTHRRPRHA